MRIVVFKYEPHKNLFENPDFIDKMKFENMPVSGFPVYNEELTSDTDQLIYKAGDWDMKFWLMQTETSFNGDSVYDFFQGNYKFLIGFTFTNDFANLWRWGILRPGGKTCDLTFSRNRYHITISMTGLLAEWAARYSSMPADAVTSAGNDATTFDEYIEYWLFGAGKVSNRLNMASKIGFMPKVSKPLQNGMIGSNRGITIWKAFKDIAQCFGFLFRMTNPIMMGDPYAYEHVPFQIELFWPSSNFGTVNLDIIEHTEGDDLLGVNDYVGIPIWHGIYTGTSSTYWDSYGGFCMNKNKYWIGNFRGLGLTETIESENGGSFTIPVDGVNPTPYSKDAFFFYDENQITPISLNRLKRINLDFYFIGPVIINWAEYVFKFVYPRIFVQRINQYNANQHIYLDEGFAQIINNTARIEYRYLIAGLKRYYDLKIKYNENLTINSNTTVMGRDRRAKTVRCLKIRDLDLFKQTQRVYLLEI